MTCRQRYNSWDCSFINFPYTSAEHRTLNINSRMVIESILIGKKDSFAFVVKRFVLPVPIWLLDLSIPGTGVPVQLKHSSPSDTDHETLRIEEKTGLYMILRLLGSFHVQRR